MALFEFHRHPHIDARSGAPKAADATEAVHGSGLAGRFNAWLAIRITNGVGTMWCAYLIGLLALVSLPSAIKGGTATLISWIAQTFLQLVLLSIIIVGQNIAAAASDQRSEATYRDADAVLHTALQIEEHLQAQDQVLERLSAPPAPAA